MAQQQVAAGQLVFKEGDPSNFVYIIHKGKVEIFKSAAHGNVRVAVLEQGEVMGEMGIFDKDASTATRSASARALEDCTLEAIERQEMQAMIKQCPEVVQHIMRTILQRFRRTTQRLSEREAASVEVVCDFTRIMIVPESEKLKAFIQPYTVDVTRLPLDIGGYPESEGARTNGVKTTHYAIPCEGPPLLVSKRHLTIEAQEKSVFLVDRGSRFGTWINGKAIGKGKGVYKIPLRKGEYQISFAGVQSPYQIKLLCQ